VTTLTPDLLAHVASVRDGACDDNELLVLADHLAEAGDEERAELIRVQCEIARIPDLRRANAGEGGIEWIRSLDRDHPAYVEDRRLLDRFRALRDRERDLLARNPAWLSVPCPECDGSGRNEYTLSGNCSLCKGAKDLLKRFVDDRTWATEPSATITRGFLDVTLPHTSCWRRECSRCRETVWDRGAGCARCDGGPHSNDWSPHPVLRAVLASRAGLWVRRVRVDGVEPEASAQHGGWWRWHTEVVPPPVYGLLDGEYLTSHYGRSTQPYWRTAEAAADALACAVPIWARGAK